MRKLTQKQKSMLDALIKENPKVFSWEELPRKEVKVIAHMTDNELVWIQMNIYIQYQWFERVNG